MLNIINQAFDLTHRQWALFARFPHVAQKFVAIKRFAPPISLDDHGNAANIYPLDRVETALAAFAAAAAMDAFGGITRFQYLRIF